MRCIHSHHDERDGTGSQRDQEREGRREGGREGGLIHQHPRALHPHDDERDGTCNRRDHARGDVDECVVGDWVAT